MLEAFPVRFLLMALAGWITQRQQVVLEYLVEENRDAGADRDGHNGNPGWVGIVAGSRSLRAGGDPSTMAHRHDRLSLEAL